jgi:hypothetical protein
MCTYVISTCDSWLQKAGKKKLCKLYQGVAVQANGPGLRRWFFDLLTEDFVMLLVAGKP